MIAERKQSRDVARFVAQRMAMTGKTNPIVMFSLILRAFPNISLRTALCGFVFRSLLAAEPEPQPMPYHAHKGTVHDA
jgi:hypothetical protein